jgi:hypothetical protein
MRLDQFQEALQSLSPIQFEQFAADVIRKSGRFSEVRLESGPVDHGIDIAAVELDPLLVRPRRWVFQVKKTRVVGLDVARYMQAISLHAQREGSTQVVLVAAGSISAAAREFFNRSDIQIWDAQKLAGLATPEVLASWFGTTPTPVLSDTTTSDKAAAFSAGLDTTVPGDDDWISYQRLVADILEFLFCPPLELPQYELSDADQRNRRDVIFENPRGDGFWGQVRDDYAAHYVVVDAKNYGKPITKRPVLDIAHYLKPYGCGMFALLVSRKGPSKSAAHAAREQWIGGRKMIVHVSDANLKEMLDIKARGGAADEVLRRQIADFGMSL